MLKLDSTIIKVYANFFLLLYALSENIIFDLTSCP